MKVIFADTNLFIQCLDLNQLPWREIYSNDQLSILVTRTVIDEIDRHKKDGNTRRASRARTISSLFRSISKSDSQIEVIRESAPRVTLSFAILFEPRNNIGCNLDPSRPDDQIINEALQYAASNPSDEVEFITYDTIPFLTAKRCGLSASIIPDGWLLPPESDPRDKKIAELELKIKEFEKTYPKIDIVINNDNDEAVDSLSLNITDYQALTEHELDEFVLNTAKRRPITERFDGPVSYKSRMHSSIELALGIEETYQPPTKDEIEKYIKEEYPEWLNKVKDIYKKLHKNYENPERCVGVSFAILNSGSMPAENILIEFKTVGGLIFLPQPDDENDIPVSKTIFPSPPSPPKGKWTKKNSSIMELVNDLQRNRPFSFVPKINNPSLFTSFPKPKDRNVFYWKNGEPSEPATVWSFECIEFLHKVDPEIFYMKVLISQEKEIRNCAIKCLITASNLPEPVRKILPIKVQHKTESIRKIAEGILEKSFPKISLI